MENTVKDKERLENISEYFFSSKSLLDRTIGFLSFNNDSFQTFLVAHLAADFLKKGFSLSLADLVKEFPNSHHFFNAFNDEDGNQRGLCGDWRKKTHLLDACQDYDDVIGLLGRKSGQDTAFLNKKDSFLFVSVPFENSHAFWVMLRMMKFVVILLTPSMEDLLRTSVIVKKLFEKNTSFHVGLVFCRVCEGLQTYDIFQKISLSVDQDFRSYIVNLGCIPESHEIFRSLLTGQLLTGEEGESLLPAKYVNSISHGINDILAGE
jgi:hypothetical protein